jgi:hypothetical protein
MKKRLIPSTTTAINTSKSAYDSLTDDDDDSQIIDFQNAYHCSGHCTPNYKVERPPIQIVDFGEHKGKGMIASRFIPKGDAIYTERAIIASQIPSAAATTISTPGVQACQNCYQSLESWKKLLPTTFDNQEVEVCAKNQFPFPELWPVPPLDFHSDDDQCRSNEQTRIDRHGRIQCKHCTSLFCSNACFQKKLDQFGSCCVERNLLKALPTMFFDDNDEEATKSEVQAPVVLSGVMFLTLAHYFRSNNNSLEGHWHQKACGTAENVQELELGQRYVDSETQQVKYTLSPLYDYLCGLLDLKSEEQNVLSLDILHSLAAKAARNGFGLCTQSPFKPYYTGLLRKTNYGGRESLAHSQHMEQLALALGKDRIYRGLDREIEEKVAPEITAMFPLTLHCNHSCTPNACVRSQEFIDNHIDVVALNHIAPGDEICISYISLGDFRWGQRSKFQRQKELLARYLFHCECERCINEEDHRTAPTF